MTDDLPDPDWRGEPAPQPRLSRAERCRRMNEELQAKLAGMSEKERAERQARIQEKRKSRPNFSGRKLTGANPQVRKSRSKDMTVAEVKELFLIGLPDAVRQARMLMMSARNEGVRLAATTLWLDRALGKIPTTIEGPGGSQVTFNIIIGVPGPDDDDKVIDLQRIPGRQD